MVRVIALWLVLMLTGTPATMACARLCDEPAPRAASASECHHVSSAPAGRVLIAASHRCDALVAGTPFLAEAMQRSSSVIEALPAVIASFKASAGLPEPQEGPFVTRSAHRPLAVHPLAVILRL